MLCITFSWGLCFFDEIILLQIWIVIVFLKKIGINFLSVKSPILISSCITWASFFVFLVISLILRIGISSEVYFFCLPSLLNMHVFVSLHTCRSIWVSFHISCRVCPTSRISSFIITWHSLVWSFVNGKVVSFSVLHKRVIDRASFVDRTCRV